MESLLLLFIVVMVVGPFIAFKVTKDRALERARRAYLESLAQLKQDPANPDLKQHTLTLGRVYSSHTRENKGHNLFDEVALMNDINAACAAATSVRRESASVSTAQPSIEARLRTLVDLRDKGLLNSAEYEKRRSEILSHI